MQTRRNRKIVTHVSETERRQLCPGLIEEARTVTVTRAYNALGREIQRTETIRQARFDGEERWQPPFHSYKDRFAFYSSRR